VRRGGNEAWSTESDIPGGEALKWEIGKGKTSGL
jgi:hypothetical protein